MKRGRLAGCVLVFCGAAGSVLACGWSLDGYAGGALRDPDAAPAASTADGANSSGDSDAPSDGGTEAAAPIDSGTRVLALELPVIDAPTDYDLTALGPLDWTQVSDDGLVRCQGCDVRIGQPSTSSLFSFYDNDPRHFTWTNGAPLLAGTSNAGAYVEGVGASYSLQFAARPALALLRIYIDTFYAGARVDAAFLGDAPDSGAKQSMVVAPKPDAVFYEIDLVVSADPPAQLQITMTVTSEVDGGDTPANIALIAAAASLANP